MTDIRIRPIDEDDRSWVGCVIRELWVTDIVVTHGEIFRPAELPGFIADENGEPLGLITYNIDRRCCEIITLDSLRESIGIGTALIEAVIDAARESGCQRVCVITTNDNLHALGFYQKRGFYLKDIRPNAIEVSRKIKPDIPKIGVDGIPLRDEIELEILL